MYLTVILAIFLLVLTATTHYEGLRILSLALDRQWIRPRDIYPIGDIRLLASIEALNGLLLVAWSGSFTYLAM